MDTHFLSLFLIEADNDTLAAVNLAIIAAAVVFW